MQPRDEQGRLASTKCPDPNCGGALVHEVIPENPWTPAQHSWRCDGLTHDTDDGPLRACDHIVFGPFVQRAAA